MWRGLKALPAYFGGKRKLVTRILKYAEGNIFIDAFIGGGNVAYYAKAQGFKVLCNDIADRSVIVGKALVENSSKKISRYDIYRLVQKKSKSPSFIERNYVPAIFTTEHARLLDNCFYNLKSFKDPVKKALLQLLLIKYIMAIRPFAMFSNGSTKKINRGIIDQKVLIKGTQNILTVSKHDLLFRMMDLVNGGVFNNGHENEIYKLDVFEFLQQITTKYSKLLKNATIYFDPPYYGAESYESQYNVLDNILRGKVEKPIKSVFNQRDWEKFIKKMLEVSQPIKKWIFSFGGPTVQGEELQGLIQEFRKAKLHKFKYFYGIQARGGEKYSDANEYIITA